MDTKKQPDKKRKPLKILLYIIGVFLLLIFIVVMIVIPLYISSDAGRRTILAKINESVDGTADFSSLNMGWFKGIKLKDVKFDDSYGMTSVRIRQVTTLPHYASILAGNLSFGSTVLDEPKVAIDLSKRPADTQGGERAEDSDKKDSKDISLGQIDLTVNSGTVTIAGTGSKPVKLADINSRIDLRPAGQKTEFNINMLLAQGDISTPIRAEGSVKQKSSDAGWTLKGTTGDYVVEVNELDLASLESFFALAGVDMQARGIASGSMTGVIKDGQIEKLNADVTGSNIAITGKALKGDVFKTSKLKFSSEIASKEQVLGLNRLDIQTDWLDATASGDLPTTLKSFNDFIKAKSETPFKAELKCNLARLASQMPRTIGFKSGMNLTNGQLSAKIEKVTEAGKSKLKAEAQISELRGLVDNRPVSLSEPVTIDAVINAQKKDVVFEKLDLASSFANISCRGTADSINYDSQVSLDKFQTELGQFVDMKGYKVAGDLSEKGNIKITDKTMTFKGTAKANNLRITSPDNVTAYEPAANFTFDMMIDRDKSLAVVNSMTANGTFGQLEIAKALIPYGEETKEKLNLSIAAKQIDLAKLKPFAALASEQVKQMTLSGLANGKINLQKENAIVKASTDSISIRNFKYAYADKQPFEDAMITARFNAEIDTEKKNFALTNMKVAGTKFSIDKGNISKSERRGITNFAGNVECEYDWKEVVALAGSHWPKELKLEGNRTTTINFASKYPTKDPDKMLANLTMKPFEIGFDKAEYLGFTAPEPTAIPIQFSNGVLDIKKSSIKVNDGTVTIAGRADFKQPAVLFKTTEPLKILDKVKVDERITTKLLEVISPIFKDVERVKGIASFSTQALEIPLKGATKKDLLLDGTFLVDKMELVSPIFKLITRYRGRSVGYYNMKIRPTRITAQNGLIRYDNMPLDVGQNPFNFVGRIDLMTKSIKGSKVITPYTLGDTIKIGQENTSGRITGDFKGTYDNPELDWGKLIQDTLLKEGLKELLKNL